MTTLQLKSSLLSLAEARHLACELTGVDAATVEKEIEQDIAMFFHVRGICHQFSKDRALLHGPQHLPLRSGGAVSFDWKANHIRVWNYDFSEISLDRAEIISWLQTPADDEASPEPGRSTDTPKRATMKLDAPNKLGVNRGGRPRKRFWDDFWIEVVRRVHSGKWSPRTASEAANDMLQWLQNQDHEAADSTVRGCMAKLFATLGWGA
jgi:hypothetical protein